MRIPRTSPVEMSAVVSTKPTKMYGNSDASFCLLDREKLVPGVFFLAPPLFPQWGASVNGPHREPLPNWDPNCKRIPHRSNEWLPPRLLCDATEWPLRPEAQGLLLLMQFDEFDCYVAICHPLRYPVVMSKAAYVPMAAGSWVAGGVNFLVQVSLAVQLPFCGDSTINHFTCEMLAVLKLGCADISINMVSMAVANVIFLAVPVLFIFVSHIFILTTILRIPSAEGRKKAFSTCSAHLTVVVVFYGTIPFMYGKPKSKDPLGADKQDLADKLISLFYGVVTSMLNPKGHHEEPDQSEALHTVIARS
nr:olfactory receptor 13C7-like [Oryctolagus cuniculus]